MCLRECIFSRTRAHQYSRRAQGIEPLVWLAGYRQLVLDLVIFDRSPRVRSENSVDLTGIDPHSAKRCLNRPDLVVAELEIVPA